MKMVIGFLLGVTAVLVHAVLLYLVPIADQSWRFSLVGASFGGCVVSSIYWMGLVDKGYVPNPRNIPGVVIMSMPVGFATIYYLTGLFERFSYPPLIVAASVFFVGAVLYNITTKFYPNTRVLVRKEAPPHEAPRP